MHEMIHGFLYSSIKPSFELEIMSGDLRAFGFKPLVIFPKYYTMCATLLSIANICFEYLWLGGGPSVQLKSVSGDLIERTKTAPHPNKRNVTYEKHLTNQNTSNFTCIQRSCPWRAFCKKSICPIYGRIEQTEKYATRWVHYRDADAAHNDTAIDWMRRERHEMLTQDRWDLPLQTSRTRVKVQLLEECLDMNARETKPD